MIDDVLPRRLAAIFYADVAGYSRLMGQDEEGTHRTVSAYLDEFTREIERHGGRIGHYAGDAILADFDSVIDALSCALRVQLQLASSNADVPEERRVQFRIGINLGEVITDRGEVYGEGVNVAARLEALAEPGGVCISEAARGAVGSQLPVELEFLGEQAVKNIAQPVRAYHAHLRPGEALPTPRGTWVPGAGRWRKAIVAAAAALTVVGGAAVWLGPWPAAVKRELADFAGPNRPSIAILPFETIGSAADDAFLSEGLTHDIIASLSRFSNLMVIAVNSVLELKDKTGNLPAAAEALGARYVVSGKLHRGGTRLRVTAQLLDASTGRNLWAERFEREWEDVFELQDEITERIVRSLATRLDKIEQKRAFSKPTDSLQAYEYVLRGRNLVARLERSSNFEARKMFRAAIELDPAYAEAYVGLAQTYHQPVLWGWTGSPTRDLEKAREFLRYTVKLDASTVSAYRLLARIHSLRGEHDAALLELERAIALNPNDAQSYAEQGVILLYAGQREAALRSLETALRHDPAMGFDYRMHLGMAYFLVERYGEAITALERSETANPDNVYIHIALAAAYATTGRHAAARRQARRVLSLDPFFKLADYGGIFRNPKDAARFTEQLRKAGLE